MAEVAERVITADDVIRSGACVSGVRAAVERLADRVAAAMPVSALLRIVDESERAYVLRATELDCYGEGGYGHGYGDGGYGYGGSLSGEGGYGCGYGDGSGDSDGRENGNGYGNGYGNGNGNGNGDGDGYGDFGYGGNYGYGDGIGNGDYGW